MLLLMRLRSLVVTCSALLILAAHTIAAVPHTNNWAVIVSTSRYWFNYRHASNGLAIYHTVRAMGIPDSQILLMLPDEYACNARNIFPGSMWAKDRGSSMDLYPHDVEVDYRGSDVTVPSFLRLLTGRHESAATPRSQRLLTDADSNILIYLSGHGGNNFLKFQDNEEMNSQDLRDALQQMHAQKRYRSILLLLDTCQAGTLFKELSPEDTPNVVTIGSSKINQNSYSLGNDYDIGVSLVDRFTFQTLNYFERNNIIVQHNSNKETSATATGLASKKTVQQLFDFYTYDNLRSEVEYRSDMLQPSIAAGTAAQPSPLSHLPLTDYFGARTHMQPTTEAYPLEAATTAAEASEHRQQQQQQKPAAPLSRHVPADSSPALPEKLQATSSFWLLLAGGSASLLLTAWLVDSRATVI